MKILLIHNNYGKTSGEEIMFNRIVELLCSHGHVVECFCRNSSEISSLFDKANAFFSGIYSFSSRNKMRQLLLQYKPDVIFVKNVFPQISPSVLVEARRNKIPVVMCCANYRLICPHGVFLRSGNLCEKCSGGREYWCILHNCEGSFSKSLGYALRNYVARKNRFFLDNVTLYYVFTEFQRQLMSKKGIPPERIHVIPNMVGSSEVATCRTLGDYVGYVGRVSPEKGVSLLLAAAAMNPDIPFKIAGAYDRMAYLLKTAPPNVEFLGHLGQDTLVRFYAGCRIVVLPSLCYETFGLSLAEAGIRGKSVICSRIGGLPEIVEDGVTGLLFEPGNAGDLAEKIRYLWDRHEVCRKMGQAGREKALREYSPEKYHERLIAVFKKAIELESDRPFISQV
jgi:glycosyltransferase involved in cell wall biosynthesis